MNCLKIIKTYPDYPNGKPDNVTAFYRWVCKKVIITDTDLHNLELSMPIYRKRKDIIVGVKVIENMSELWTNINPFASELFNSKIIGDCYIIFENIDNTDEFNLWCNIIKQDLIKLGSSDKSFTY